TFQRGLIGRRHVLRYCGDQAILIGVASNSTDWQGNGESGAQSFAGAFGFNVAPMQLHQVFNNRQAESDASVLALAGSRTLTEAVKHEGQEFRANASARIADADLKL